MVGCIDFGGVHTTKRSFQRFKRICGSVQVVCLYYIICEANSKRPVAFFGFGSWPLEILL